MRLGAGMARVARDRFAPGRIHDWAARRNERQLLERIDGIALVHLVLVTSRGHQRRLVHEVPQIGANEPRAEEATQLRSTLRAGRSRVASVTVA
jgi:hypothetical protein